MRYFSFTKWLKTKETFNSYSHYIGWLATMSKNEAENVNTYYHEKYKYFLKNIQTEWD